MQAIVVFWSNSIVFNRITSISTEILGFSFEILGISKTCHNLIPYECVLVTMLEKDKATEVYLETLQNCMLGFFCENA